MRSIRSKKPDPTTPTGPHHHRHFGNLLKPIHPLGPHEGLIVLNVVLLGVLAMITLGPGAGAQTQPPAGSGAGPNAGVAGQGGRPRGSYMMVGGEISSGNSNAIWVLDTSNQELIAMVWDLSRSRVQGLGYRDLAGDAKAPAGR